jgi:hypothetical protein
MKGYVFDPGRLRRSPKHPERDGYAVAGRMLREHLGGDLLADLGRRLRNDPAVREALDGFRQELEALRDRRDAAGA